MRLQFKVNLVSLGILVAVACALTVVGVVAMDRVAFDLNRRLLSAEAASLTDKIAETQSVLADSGVAAVRSYMERAQQDLVQEFAQDASSRFGHLVILTSAGQTVLGMEASGNRDADLPCLKEMLAQGKGELTCSFLGRQRLVFFRTFPEWDWVVMLSATDQEMYAARVAFVKKALAILVVSLLLGGGILLWLTRGIVGPLQRLAEAAMALSRGQWRQRLPESRSNDEVGELTRSFAEMAERLEEAHGNLAARADDLRRVNADLSREVAERRKAEEELAWLNRDLENLVAVRTSELAGKAEELREANRRLMELDELKSAFLSSVSHELRTPLTSVLGFTKLIFRDFEAAFLPLAGDEALRKKGMRIHANLRIIEQEGERLTRLINDFLDLTKIESGRIEWCDREMDLEDAVRKALASVHGLFEQNPAVRLRFATAEGLPPVYADPDRMEQVFINLLNNAAKFTAAGEVAVTMDLAPDGFARVRVADTGVGIPQGELDKVFDKFHQVVHRDTLRQKPQGTGLGLAICRQIVRHYGGRIWAEANPAGGSTFVIELPPAEAVQACVSTGPEPGKPLVLVADDDQAVCAFLSQTFADAGFAVLVAANGNEVLELAAAHKPDLITMDILMPGLDGRQAMARLREDPELAAIPILVITVLHEERFGGEDATLRKPVEPGALLDAAFALLNRSCPARPVRVLRRNGLEPLGPFFAMCRGEIVHLYEEELWKEIEAGFQGTVIIPGWAARSIDLARLRSRAGVQVLILPEGMPLGHS
jgi:signal transduction histidine kinase